MLNDSRININNKKKRTKKLINKYGQNEKFFYNTNVDDTCNVVKFIECEKSERSVAFVLPEQSKRRTIGAANRHVPAQVSAFVVDRRRL